MVKNKEKYVRIMTEEEVEIIVNEILEILERENICVGLCNAVLEEAQREVTQNSFVRIKKTKEV